MTRLWTSSGVICLLLAAGPLSAQEEEEEKERPRVERLVLRGVEALDERELRKVIVTEDTRCRSMLLRPFCWVSDWGVFVDHKYLDREELRRDELRLRVHYFRRGYREAEVSSEVRPRGRGVEVEIEVHEGPPTLITALDLTQTTQVLSARRIQRARVPGEGQPLDLIRLDSARAELQAALEEQGYLDATIADTILVSARLREAQVSLRIDPQRRSTVAGIDIRGNRDISHRTITDGTVLREGRILRSSDIAAAQRSLYESNLFHEAVVSVPQQEDSAKIIVVAVREAPPRMGRTGTGFNTHEFVQVEGRFVHYNWMGGGRRLDLRGVVGNLLAPQLQGIGLFSDLLPRDPFFDDRNVFLLPTWQLSGELTQPAFRRAENRLGVSVFAHRRAIHGIAIDNGLGAGVSATRQLRDRSPVSLAYRFELNRVDAGDLYFCINYVICDRHTIDALRESRRLSPISLSFLRERVDDPLGPSAGRRMRLDVEHAAKYTLSDFSYIRLSGEVSRYHQLGLGRSVIAGRVRFGWVRPTEGTTAALDLPEGTGELLHPRKRFYAGGSQSVRGYGENQLGPRILAANPDLLMDPGEGQPCTAAQIADGTCDPNFAPAEAFLPRPLGGIGVLQGNVEYRFPVWRQIAGAVFVDGAIVPGPGESVFGAATRAVTPGFGVRYESPVGPVRFDIGIRPAVTERLPVVTEIIGEDGERRIVMLDTERRWNPVEARGGGFLSNVLARVRIHLAIGEAF